jgi:hypothetical protein
MIIKILRFNWSKDFYIPSRRIGVVSTGTFDCHYKVIDEHLFFLAVIKHNIVFEKVK